MTQLLLIGGNAEQPLGAPVVLAPDRSCKSAASGAMASCFEGSGCPLKLNDGTAEQQASWQGNWYTSQ